MSEIKYITTPLTEETVKDLHAGDFVRITGPIYTARDAAHKRMYEALGRGEGLPFDVKDNVIYYVGPTPDKPGEVVGSAGPTTSGRMDKYTPTMIEQGMKGMIGKGKRDDAVLSALAQHKAVYFGATGGVAALLSQCVKKAEVILFPELGPEAVRRLEVEDFPVVVINDMYGGDLYRESIKKYNEEI